MYGYLKLAYHIDSEDKIAALLYGVRVQRIPSAI
jgi:hypothetical protein